MKRALAIISAACLASPCLGQDQRQAVDEALGDLGSITDRLTTDTLENTVIPFAGVETPETYLHPADYDRAILDVKTGDGADGRAYQSNVDSFAQRPAVDLGDDPLALADDAVANADAALGGFFSADSGTCEAIFQDGSYGGERFCTAILERQIEVCDVWREISVDREDFWACEIAERDFTRRCNRDVSWECTGTTQSSCRQSRIRADRPFTWRRNSSVMHFEFPGGGFPSLFGCIYDVERIVVDAYVGFNPDTLRVTEFNHTGFAQLRVNGRNIYTAFTNLVGDLNVQDPGVTGKGIPLGPIAYIDDTPLDACLFEILDTEAGPFDLLPRFDWPQPGPTRFTASHRPYVSMQEHDEIVIEIIRAVAEDHPTSLKLEVGGSCCSAIRAVGGLEC